MRASGQVSVEFALLSIIVLTGALLAGTYLGPEYEWYCVKKAVSDAVAKTREQVAIGVSVSNNEISGRLSASNRHHPPYEVSDDEIKYYLSYSGKNTSAVVELLRRNVLEHVYMALHGRPRPVEEIPNPVSGSWAKYSVSVSGGGGGGGEIVVDVRRITG